MFKPRVRTETEIYDIWASHIKELAKLVEWKDEEGTLNWKRYEEIRDELLGNARRTAEIHAGEEM